MTRLNERIAENLKRARKASGLTQQALAEKAGVSVGTVARYEQGRTTSPRDTELDRIATAVGKTADQIRGIPDDPDEMTTNGTPRNSDPLVERLRRVFGPNDTAVITDWLDETRHYAPEDRIFTVRAVEWLQSVMRSAREYRDGYNPARTLTPDLAR